MAIQVYLWFMLVLYIIQGGHDLFRLGSGDYPRKREARHDALGVGVSLIMTIWVAILLFLA